MLRQSFLLRAAASASMVTILDGECVLQFNSEEKVALLSLQRHACKNAIGKVMLNQLRSAIEACAGRGPSAIDVRCLVLESLVPGVFCAGADLKERKLMSVDEARAFVDTLRGTFCELEDLEIPTITALEGKALGGGMELALSTDMRLAGSEAVMGFPETGLAIIPGAGGTVRAPRLIGASAALELILSAEPVNASRAMELRLVNRVVPAGSATQEALKLAARIARNGPLGVRAAKASVKEGYGKLRDAAMAVEHANYEKVLATQDRLEGLKAFAEKRQPVYLGK